MPSFHFLTYTFAITAIASLIGCATPARTTSASAGTPAITVPKLRITTACGACQVRPNVPSLIESGYKDAAAKSGARVSTTDEATVTIDSYTDRSDAARVLAGMFAGKDEIRANVKTKDKTFVVEDYYRNAWLGIESLANKIGGMIFEQVK